MVITTTAIVLAFAVQPIDELRKSSELYPFDIEIHSSEDRNFKMSCISGCAWNSLTFSYNSRTLISYSGVQTSPFSHQVISDTDSPYLFQIEREGNSVVMKGFKGQAWETLSYSSTPADTISFRINEMGMVSEGD